MTTNDHTSPEYLLNLHNTAFGVETAPASIDEAVRRAPDYIREMYAQEVLATLGEKERDMRFFSRTPAWFRHFLGELVCTMNLGCRQGTHQFSDLNRASGQVLMNTLRGCLEKCSAAGDAKDFSWEAVRARISRDNRMLPYVSSAQVHSLFTDLTVALRIELIAFHQRSN